MSVLDGKNAFITGASGGIGREIALELAARGCKLFLTGRNGAKLTKVAAEVGDSCVGFFPCYLDSQNITNLIDVANAALKKMGNVDILVNCAGIFPVKSLESTKIFDYDECFSVNVRAPFLFTKFFVEGMKENGWGRVVNIGSSSAYGGFKNTSVYCASKHALLGLSRALNDELKPHNIRVLSVSPGSVKTEMGKMVPNQDYETFIDPEDIATVVSDIVSHNSNMMIDEIRLNRVNVQ
tara:strand:- start:655 stop:1368 length:714 start_codon:yes stop_codon:yes gene_type:complete